MAEKSSSTTNILLLCLTLSLYCTIQAEGAIPSSRTLKAEAQANIAGSPNSADAALPVQIPDPVVEEAQREAGPSNLPSDVQPTLYQRTAAFGSHAAPSMPLLAQLLVDSPLPVSGVQALYPRLPQSVDISQSLDELKLQQTSLNSEGLYSMSNAKPLVCTNNPLATFYPEATKASSICRAYLYLNSNRTKIMSCTAFFVTSTHVVLAGSCVANGGSKKYLPVAVNSRYGGVCCKVSKTTTADSCPAGYGFDVIQVTATSGWLNNGTASNDGAALKLRRPTNTVAGLGVPLAYEQTSPFCPQNTLTYAGYPADGGWLVNLLSGCPADAAERLAFSNTGVLNGCFNATNLPSYQFVGSTCLGIAGAPLWNPPTNTVWGIHTQGGIICVNGTSNVGFSAITNGNTKWGVSIASLLKAIP